jgi:hypothetical protein
MAQNRNSAQASAVVIIAVFLACMSKWEISWLKKAWP